MTVEIVRADPTGNATILVLSPVLPSDRTGLASRLMALDGGWAEQVGFLSESEERDRLDMMGGEFCGNASMSAAAFLAEERGIYDARLSLAVSGAPKEVVCTVRKDGGDWDCGVDMPLPESVRREEFRFGGRTYVLWAVRFPGIVHVIVPKDWFTRTEAEEAVRQWAYDTGAAALGVLLFSRDDLRMTPLVYVRATNSAVWERGCASGTSAIGACLAASAGGDGCAKVRQPGGVIEVTARWQNGQIVSLRINGRVKLLDRDCFTI